MLKWTAAAIALLAVLTSAAPPSADQQPLPVGTPESPLKNATGAGHYYGGGEKDYKKDHGSYGRASYGGDYSTSYHQLIDDYVCDADASILVVTNSHKGYDRKGYGGEKGYESDKSYGGDKGGYGPDKGGYGSDKAKGGYGSDKGYGYGKSYGKGYSRPEGISGKDYGRSHENTYEHKNYAERLRCASIAVQSDRDCSQCCRIAARRDRSVSKEDIVGFVVDYDQVNTHNRIGYGEEKDYGSKSYGHEEKGYGGEGGYGHKGGEYKREKGGYGSEKGGYGSEKGGYGSEKGGYGGEYKRSKRSGDQETYPVEDKIGGGGGHHPSGNKGHGHHSGEAHPPGYTPEDKGYRHEKKYDGDRKEYNGHEEKGYSGKGYGKADYGSDRIEVADYYKPSNPRCVCCSPKRYVHRESYGYGGGDYGRKGEY